MYSGEIRKRQYTKRLLREFMEKCAESSTIDTYFIFQVGTGVWLKKYEKKYILLTTVYYRS